MSSSSKSHPYRGRFAPSPTGPLHFGSLVAAVGSYLEARTRGGKWLVRMEDLDTPRIVPGVADDILRTLEALGMSWDGAVVYQSTRNDTYRAALEQLRTAGRVYPCTCSRREIADSALAGIDGYVYPGTCRNGLPAGKTARAIRVDTRGAYLSFDDAIQGQITQDLEQAIGDFVVLRADGLFAYQLAVVVDDAAQGITHVVRGADLLDSTPRQLHLQQLLRLATPRYAHLPVAVNAQGEKLSKQTLAPPINTTHPAREILRALRFLGLRTPPALEQATPHEIWQWATQHWEMAGVLPRRTIAIEES